MSILILLALISLVFSKKISTKENCFLKAHCGDHFLANTTRPKRSIGGIKAKQNEFPWIAAFYVDKVTQPYGFVKKYGCSAVQISKRHILTAAHCVVQASPILTKLCDEGRSSTAKYTVLNPSDFTLFIGSGCTNPDRCLHPKRYYSVKKVFVYTFYDACNLINDIAVLEISPNILPSDGYPVCMPRQDDLLENTLTAVGFGIDPTTRRRQREILSDLRSVNLTRSTPDIPKTIKTVDNKKSICLGDSGGPLTQNKDDANYTAVGIASARFPACSQPTRVRSSYFTDVRKFLSWICNKTGVCPIRNSHLQCKQPFT